MRSAVECAKRTTQHGNFIQTDPKEFVRFTDSAWRFSFVQLAEVSPAIFVGLVCCLEMSRASIETFGRRSLSGQYSQKKLGPEDQKPKPRGIFRVTSNLRHCGYLHLLEKVGPFSKWKRYYFVLDEESSTRTLSWYRDEKHEKSGAFKGRIHLLDSVSRRVERLERPSLCFRLTTESVDGRLIALDLQGELEQEVDSWIEQLTRNSSNSSWSSLARSNWEIPFKELEFEESKDFIGSGGTSHVCKAKWNQVYVAVKIFSPDLDPNKLQNEIAILASIRHPHIVEFIGACLQPPNISVVTQFMKRGSLQQVLHDKEWFYYRKYRFSWRLFLKMIEDTASGLLFLHNFAINGAKNSIVHCDLKPGNLLVNSFNPGDVVIKLTDFGSSKDVSLLTSSQTIAEPVETAHYAAPEVIAGHKPTTAADVFSLGCVMYEILMRKVPYSEYSFGFQVTLAISQGERPVLPQSLDRDMKTIVNKCLLEPPQLRPSVQEIVEFVQKFRDPKTRNVDELPVYDPTFNPAEYENARVRVGCGVWGVSCGVCGVCMCGSVCVADVEQRQL